MFRRFADRVSDAVSAATEAATGGSTTTDNDTRVAELSAMGFREAEARHALRVSGNLETAAEWLLTHGTPIGAAGTTTGTTTASRPGTRNNPIAVDDEGDDDIQRAIQASLDHRTAPAPRKANNATKKTTQSAASKNAGMAAARRSNSPTSNNNKKDKGKNKVAIASHPSVQVPKRLSQHDKEDVILRCAARIAPHPMAVDTLLRSLKTIQANPNNSKYQVVDTTTAGFQRSLTAPGVLDFLKAVNFHPSSNQKIIRLSFLDPATFYLGISALEQVQLTSKKYAYSKALLQFDKEIAHHLTLADTDMNEALKRSAFMSKCPSEPASSASQITVELGSTTKINRKFDGDDTLRDVLNWLGSHASTIPEKLLVTKTGDGGTGSGGEDDSNAEGWYLVDRNHANERPYNVPELMDRTLQYIGCWPSGRLAVVPVLKNMGDDDDLRIPSSRGLGAGPAEHLKM